MRSWRAARRAAMAEIPWLLDHDGRPRTVEQSGHPLLQPKEEHRGDDPHDGASGREVPRSAEALSLLGCGLVAYFEAPASARRGAQRRCAQRRWTNDRDRST